MGLLDHLLPHSAPGIKGFGRRRLWLSHPCIIRSHHPRDACRSHAQSPLRDTGGFVVDSGIMYRAYAAADRSRTGNSTAVSSGVKSVEEIDKRHQQSFRNFETGFPFEYYMVRFFCHGKRDIESAKPPE